MSCLNPPPNFFRKPRISVRQVWRRTTPKSPPTSQNASPSPHPRVNPQSSSPPSHNPLRDQMINQLHNISSILESHTQNSSNAYSHAPPSLPSPLIRPPTNAQVKFHSSFCHCNCQRKEEEESGPKWVIRSKFKDELAGFMLEKKSHTKGIGEMLDQHRKKIHEQFSRILTTIGENKILESGAPTFAITTRSGASTRDPPFPNSSQPTTTDHTEGTIEREGSESEEPRTFQNEEIPQSPTLYHPSKSSSVPFPSRLKKQKKDDDEE
ncbi:hypothetical protein Tco_0839766 [Tanacetum coccineum]|uniref:Uncharacterized protein n=1 Tax=Tanacetum coccineum TaxID=301880 RepID=A0ABQ5AWJ7_9ASTR